MCVCVLVRDSRGFKELSKLRLETKEGPSGLRGWTESSAIAFLLDPTCRVGNPPGAPAVMDEVLGSIF